MSWSLSGETRNSILKTKQYRETSRAHFQNKLEGFRFFFWVCIEWTVETFRDNLHGSHCPWESLQSIDYYQMLRVSLANRLAFLDKNKSESSCVILFIIQVG